ncbi:MAG TPA: immunoglobulin domain-containing protein, partial [Candidatus Dormibacteraeota bacterium]|nr:immunoglobulin domain-containing protein [Candidatus Dormibacteraeota bacterium]
VGKTVTNAMVTYSAVGPNNLVFSQNFDSVTAPALPSGWSASATGVESPWVTSTASRDTSPNSAFVPDAANIGSSDLVSPPIPVPSGSAQLAFRHSYDFETGPGTDGYDGGVLEIKIGTNAFADIISAGGAFQSGAYNSTIDPAYSNPLAGRNAWSASSGGFIQTMVNLPVIASGQTIQLKWRAGSDNSNGKTGWYVDSVSISNRACLCCTSSTNNPPSLPAQSNKTVAALTTLTVTNSASDPDVPPQVLSYTLVAPPPGASISANGIITWTPSAGQAPGTNTISTIVTDNGSPALSATNSFLVVVTAANAAPLLPTQPNQTIAELTTLLITNTATDPDGPQSGLSYALLSGPAGASISATGVINWTPGEAQGPSTNTFTTKVTDSGTPPLSATNSFVVVVTEVNSAPVLPVQPNRTIAELTTLSVNNAATDSDIPANALTYTLLAAPAGVSISTAGVINWTPTEAQGPSTNTITTRVLDNGTPTLGATNSFTVVVTEVNAAPVLPAQTNRSVIELTQLIVTNTATDSDLPANILSYVLVNPPSGAIIATNGIISWTPTAAQGPGTNVLTTIVTDDGRPPLSATNSFTVFVIDTNTPPVITAQPASQTNAAGTTAIFAVGANGASLSYQWARNGTNLTDGGNISGAATATLNVGSVSSSDATSYRVVVSNPYGSVTSSVAALTVILPPAITSQPSSRTNNTGTTATFTAGVTGTSPALQWLKNGATLSNGGNVSGATSLTLTLTSVSATDAGGYALVATNIAGSVTSSVATLTVNNTNAPPTQLFADNFSRTTLAPWIADSGTWTVGNGVLSGSNPAQGYGFAYITNSWTDYSVQARIRFSSTSGTGGGIGARLNPITGSHYAAWVYPENSAAGPSVLRLIKFQDFFGAWEYKNVTEQEMALVSLPGVGTNWHTLQLSVQGNQLSVFYDSNQVASVTDVESNPYLTGAVSADMFADANPYSVFIDDVTVTALPPVLMALNDLYFIGQGNTLSVAAPGILGNDTAVSKTNFTASLLQGPSRGSVTFNSSGAFTYTPNNGVAGIDSFTYMANDGISSSRAATVNIDITPSTNLFYDDFSRTTTTNQLAPWVVGLGEWTVTNGTLLGTAALANDYSDCYIPANFSDFSIQAHFRLPSSAWACGLSGRINPATGARYVANVYPESSPLGPTPALRLIKFHDWITWSPTFTAMALVPLPSVGTATHTLKVTYQGNTIDVYYDGSLVVHTNDTGFDGIPAYTSGAAGAHMYMDAAFTATFDDVTITPISATNTPPAITRQPVSLTNNAGTTATFSVGATGTSLTYQWRKGGTNMANGGNVTGATGSALALANVASGDAGTYSVVVANSAGSVTSTPATLTVVISTNPPGQFFADDFTRPADPGALSPWIAQSGTWKISGGLLSGTAGGQGYADLYVTNSWTNYSCQAQVRFTAGSYGGGLGGYLNASSGTRYAAWIFPEGSTGGSNTLKLFKFKNWKNYSYNNATVPMAQVNLASVGTNWHTLNLAFSATQISVSYDGTQMLATTDTETTRYSSGAISVDQRTGSRADTMYVDNVLVTSTSIGGALAAPLLQIPPIVTAAPVIQSLALSDGQAVITWTANSGSTYRLQFKDSLAAPDWKDVSPDIIASGPSATATNSIDSAPQRFYRILLVQ